MEARRGASHSIASHSIAIERTAPTSRPAALPSSRLAINLVDEVTTVTRLCGGSPTRTTANGRVEDQVRTVPRHIILYLAIL